MMLRHLFWFLALISSVSCESCPSGQPGLASFEELFPDLKGDEDVEINSTVLLNVRNVNVSTITISGAGKLVFGQGHPISIETKGILVKGNGALIIGSETCAHEDEVNIILKGQRTEDRSIVGEEGDRYIAVTDNGVVQIFGQDKRPWTKLSQTAERFTQRDYSSNVVYHHAKSENADKFTSRGGLMMYKFNNATFNATSFGVLTLGNTNPTREQKYVNKHVETINDIQDGEIVAIAVNNKCQSEMDLSELFDALEKAAGLPENSLLLRTSEPYDAFALVFIKGGGNAHQRVDKMLGKEDAKAIATIMYGAKKISAHSSIKYMNTGRSTVNVRILDAQIGFPVIRVAHNISSWNIGDKILLTSSDYAWHHGEVRTILSKEDDFTLRLIDELEYRHFGEIEDGVDMRAEVALLTRNIKIQGQMSRDCPSTNGNCERYNYDTYGGHVKIYNSFGSVHIQGVELMNMGQTQDKGHYPIHFHMCKNITGKTALIKYNSIHDSYARCVTVHGTYGTSKSQLGVQVVGNVAHNIMGHCFFLEDGAEIATSLVDNLGAGIKGALNDFVTDRNQPTVYWITNPKVILKGNVAAGSEGFGIWYTFPIEPVGPSKGLVFREKEAKHTPIWDFDNNVVHSNLRGGMNFDNILDDENGTVVACMQYFPVVNATDPNSASTKVQFTRLTAYKNRDINCWLRGGWFEMMQFASADSKKGLQFARGSDQQMFVKKSIFIGKSANNYEDDDYPDKMSDADLKQYLGVVFHDGPTYVQTSWFKSFKSCTNGECVAAALGFATKNKFTSSVVSNVTDVRFHFNDPSEGNRVYDGIVDETSLGIGTFDGAETATFRDEDGSVSRCSEDLSWSYPVQLVTPEKYLLTDRCTYKDNWALAICKSKYGKVNTTPMSRWSGRKEDFDKAGYMRRVSRSNSMDTAVESHPDLHSNSYMVLLGDNRYYYQFQFKTEFPKDVIFQARGIERGADVVIGFCLPKGANKDNMHLFYKSPNNVFLGNQHFKYVDSLNEVYTDQHMTRVFLDKRILYVKFSSKIVRDDAWDKHDADHCPGDFCPRLRIKFNEQLRYNRCFKATEDELSNIAALASTPKEQCNLGTSLPETDWGVGDTFLSHDGQWGDWTGWTDCCNNGTNTQTTTRYRLCDNPPKHGDGADCVGPNAESNECGRLCPVDGTLGDWTGWSDCTCDGIGEDSQGARFRTRTCDETANGGTFCKGTTENLGTCRGGCYEDPLRNPVDGTRTEWAEWSDCFCDGIASGSRGARVRSKSCVGTKRGGDGCSGYMATVESCIGDCGYD